MLPLASFTGIAGLRLQPYTGRLKPIQREAPSTGLEIAEMGATLSPGVNAGPMTATRRRAVNDPTAKT